MADEVTGRVVACVIGESCEWELRVCEKKTEIVVHTLFEITVVRAKKRFETEMQPHTDVLD